MEAAADAEVKVKAEVEKGKANWCSLAGVWNKVLWSAA